MTDTETKKGKVGRPTVDTPELRKKIEMAASYDCTHNEMALYAGISRETLHQIFKADEQFSDRIKTLRDTPVMLARETVIKAMKKRPKLAFKYLERKVRKEFGTGNLLGIPEDVRDLTITWKTDKK